MTDDENLISATWYIIRDRSGITESPKRAKNKKPCLQQRPEQDILRLTNSCLTLYHGTYKTSQGISKLKNKTTNKVYKSKNHESDGLGNEAMNRQQELKLSFPSVSGHSSNAYAEVQNQLQQKMQKHLDWSDLQ